MKIWQLMLVFGAVIVGGAMPANAIVNVINMSDKPQSFIVSERTNEQHIITIEANRTWQTYAQQITISPESQPDMQFIGRTWDTFAYWPNDTFGIQFRRRRQGRH